MIYFDNAATTMVKPPQVIQTVVEALGSFGGVGRGVHPASLNAGRAVFDARASVARLLGAPSASCVSFALNATMALNITLQGLASSGSRIVTTSASHNSVLRPLFRLRDERNCQIKIAPIRRDGSLNYEEYEHLLVSFRPHIVVATHSSNLTGDVYDIARMARVAHDNGALFVLDAAQTAGSIPLSQEDLGVDVLCFTGHKSLFGPQGTGGLCVVPEVNIPPLLEGGSGTHTFEERHPCFMPEALEAGTVNAHGLAGLCAGIHFIEERGIDSIHAHTRSLVQIFEEEVKLIEGLRVLGGHGGIDRCGIVAIDVDGVDAGRLGDCLAQEYGICVRAGAHCAPLMHRSLGTEDRGAVRFSFSYFNTEEEVERGIRAVKECVTTLRC